MRKLERAYMRKLSQMRQLLSNKGSSTSDVQANGSKRRRQATRGRKSTKTTLVASPSSKVRCENTSSTSI